MRDETRGMCLDVREESLAFEVILSGGTDDSPLMRRVHSENTNTVMLPPETDRSVSEAEAALLAHWTGNARSSPTNTSPRPLRPR